jgi:acyl carrier protein
MLTDTVLIEQLKSIFSTELSIEINDECTDLLDAGIIDSLTMVDLLSNLEGRYGFTVVMEELDIEFFRNLQSIAEYVKRASSSA